jgi:carboxylesterase
MASANNSPGVFLVHGLGGTQYDLGAMHKHFKNHGFTVHSLTLPGHGTRPEDLLGVTANDWLHAVTAKYREALAEHETLHVIGMCLGSLLATEVVKRERHERGRLTVLAPPIYIDGWATPWYVGARRLLYRLPLVKSRMRIEEEDPFGIKNDLIRSIVKAKFERGEAFHYKWVPLHCIEQVDRLRGMVMRNLAQIRCETLIMHAREDELTSPRSADFLVRNIGRHARMIVLENSYHMVCVDNDRDFVAIATLKHFGVAEPQLVRRRAEEEETAVKMSAAEIREIASRYFSELQAGRFEQLLPLFASDVAWHAGGLAAGEYNGRSELVTYFSRLMEVSGGAFRVTNVEKVMVADQLAAAPLRYTGGGGADKQGLQVLRFREGKIAELWGFDPDDAQEGIPALPPSAPQPTVIAVDQSLSGAALKSRFEAAVNASRTLPRRPENATLLEMYAFFKQGTEGDASGERPGFTDLVGRAKFDAWSRLAGTDRDSAMRRYVALVDSLQARGG